MGYFSNGTEGAMYEERYCRHCVHSDIGEGKEVGVDPPCPVWMAHLLYNYDECNNDDSVLHMLIPRNGIENEQCRMFVRASDRSLVGAQPDNVSEESALRQRAPETREETEA